MEDEAIVRLYWERDEQALKESEIKYGSYCSSIARNILDIWEDVQECVNDTWLKAWNAIPPHRPSLLSVFLGKITRNLAFDTYRREQREKRGGYTGSSEVYQDCLYYGLISEAMRSLRYL